MVRSQIRNETELEMLRVTCKRTLSQEKVQSSGLRICGCIVE
jgi:hypothetical protein